VRIVIVDGMVGQKQIEIILSKLLPYSNPKLNLEEYSLDSKSAAKILSVAGMIYNDIIDKCVIDLGCGTGILAIGAALIGAKHVVGIDIDDESINIAKKNAREVAVEVDYLVGDIRLISSSFDTTLMNPPFGSWNRGIDIIFLMKALQISKVIYSLHKRSEKSREYLARKIASLGGKIEKIFELEIILPHTYAFHRKKKYYVKTDLYRIKTIT
jgi:putative methylase